MKSMTGFGRGTVSGEDFSVAVEIKTVNNRYLDIHLRMGQELSAVESSIRRRVGVRLSRGRVDLNINFERTGATVYEVNRPLIAGYIGAMQEIQERSEEHTAELQSHSDLVCRLLLEKKKKK